jgi:hypothetical protein
MSTIPHCLNNRLIDGGEAVSITRRQRSTPQKHFFLLLTLISEGAEEKVWIEEG